MNTTTNHEQAVVALLGDIRQKLVEAVTAGAHGCGDPLHYALGVMAGWKLPDATPAPADCLRQALAALQLPGEAAVARAVQLLGQALGDEAAEPVNPSGYAYRYPDGYIRFSNGETINGSGPTESIPYYFGAPPAADARSGQDEQTSAVFEAIQRNRERFTLAAVAERVAPAGNSSAAPSDELDRLLTVFGNLQFDCGAWTDENSDQEGDYKELVARSKEARAALRNFIARPTAVIGAADQKDGAA